MSFPLPLGAIWVTKIYQGLHSSSLYVIKGLNKILGHFNMLKWWSANLGFMSSLCSCVYFPNLAVPTFQRIWDLETPASFTSGVDSSSTRNDLITAKALWAIDWPFGRSMANNQFAICHWFCQPPTFPAQHLVVVGVPAVYKIYRVDSWPRATSIFW